MRIQRLGIYAAVALALLVGGCHVHNSEPGSPQPAASPVQGTPFEVHVTNTMGMPMNVGYRYGGDIVTILGIVPVDGTATFTVPNRGGDNLEIQATDQDGGNLRHERVDMKAGSVLSITLK